MSAISSNAFSGNSDKTTDKVIITKFDASTQLSGKTLTKATLTFHSACTVSGKNSQVHVATIGTGWDATTATWSNTNTAEILNATDFYTSTSWINTKGSDLSIDVTEYMTEAGTCGFGIFTGTAREQKITNLQLTIEAVDASSSAIYTVKFVDEEGNEVKTAETHTESIGASASIKDEDKASIYNSDKTVKYLYVSDDADGKTVANDGSTVVTIKFRKAETWSYVFNAIDADGNSLKSEIVKGQNFEAETLNVGYPTYINIDGTLYQSSKLSSDGKGYYISLTLDESNITKDITYNITDIADVVYFSEAENIEGLTLATNGNTAIRSSCGASAYAADADVVFATLPAGKYKLSTVICDATKNAGSKWNFIAGSDTIFTITASSVNWSSGTSEEFTLTKETSIALAKGGNKNQAVDLIYIQKTGDYIVTPSATEVKTITDLKALADGTDVELTLSNAKLTFVGMGGSGYAAYIEDETGGIVIDNEIITALSEVATWMESGKLISGTIYAKYSVSNGMPTLAMNDDVEKNATSVTATTPDAAFTPTAITFADVKEANVARYVKLSDVELSGSLEEDLIASNGTDSITIVNKYFISVDSVPAKAQSVAGILVTDGNGSYSLYLISADDIVAAEEEPTPAPVDGYKTISETTVFLTTSANVAAAVTEGWAEGGTTKNDKSGNINPSTGEECEATKFEGVGVKSGNGDKTLTLKVTGVNSIVAYGVSTSGTDTRILVVKATASDGTVVTQQAETAPSTTAVVTLSGLDASLGYTIDFTGVDANGKGADVAVQGVKFVVGSDIPAAINSIGTESALNGNVYTIGGTMVRKAGEKLNGLSKGIYIVNGKKVVVK